MKRKHHSVEQIVAILKQAEVGVLVAERIRHAGDLGADFVSLEVDQVRSAATGAGRECELETAGRRIDVG